MRAVPVKARVPVNCDCQAVVSFSPLPSAADFSLQASLWVASREVLALTSVTSVTVGEAAFLGEGDSTVFLIRLFGIRWGIGGI